MTSTIPAARGARSTARPRPRSDDEAAFLAIGKGAHQWIKRLPPPVRRAFVSKMADAISLAKLLGAERVDAALGIAAMEGRFGDGDLALILAHPSADDVAAVASDDHSLQPGTSKWRRLS